MWKFWSEEWDFWGHKAEKQHRAEIYEQFAQKRKEKDDKEFWAAAKPSGIFEKKGVFLGYGDMWSYPPTTLPLLYNGNQHLVTFGPTGSGKGVCAQIPALLDQSAPSSALVIDVKGELAAVTGKARAAAGQSIYAINPFDVLKIPTVTYNPLRFLDPESLSFSTDCLTLAESLMNITKGDHWELSALDLVTLLIQWTVLFEEEKNLLTVRRLVNQSESERIAFFERMMICPRPEIAEGAARYTSDAKEVRDCVSTAAVQLAFLRDSGVARILKGGGQEISFADLKRKLMTVYLIIPPKFLHSHGRFLRLLVASAMNELYETPLLLENPVLFMLDEFAALGHMASIENAANVARAYKIRLWVILQNVPQLKSIYKDRWESFLSAAGVVQIFGANDVETASWVSKRSGDASVLRKSKSTSTSTNEGGKEGPTKTTAMSESESEAFEPTTRLEQAISIKPGWQFIFVPGRARPWSLNRKPYYEDENFKNTPGLVPNPYVSLEQRKAFEESMRGINCFSDNVVLLKPHNQTGIS
jgi:type IV secretion system protein VirD4